MLLFVAVAWLAAEALPAQLLADRARRRALGLLQLAARGPACPPHRPQPWAWPRPRPAYLPHPRRRLPRVRGWCGFIENGAYEGRPFPTPNDAPCRFPVAHPGRPGAGFLRCLALTAAPYRFGPTTRPAAAGHAASYSRTKPAAAPHP